MYFCQRVTTAPQKDEKNLNQQKINLSNKKTYGYFNFFELSSYIRSRMSPKTIKLCEHHEDIEVFICLTVYKSTRTRITTRC